MLETTSKESSLAVRRSYGSKPSIWHQLSACRLGRKVADLLKNSRQCPISALQPYQYQALGRNEVRLLILLKGYPHEDIHIEIEHRSIHDVEGGFAALSYVWGEQKQNLQPVRIDKYYVHYATYNLSQALKRIRSEEEDLVLWVDAICINQKDNAEKASHLGHMSRIFYRARRVLCWLGDDDGTILESFKVLKKWSCSNLSTPQRLELNAGTKQLLEQKLSDQPTALTRLFNRPYFRRAWTLQEVYTRRENPPLLMCGEFELSWDDLYMGTLTMAETLGRDEILRVGGESLLHVTRMLSIGWLQQEDLYLSHLLPSAAGRETTKQHDKLFSLLGLVEGNGLAYPTPSYEDSFSKTCIVFTRAIMVAEKRLSLLSHVGGYLVGEETPSWSMKPDRWFELGAVGMSFERIVGRPSGKSEGRYKYDASGGMEPIFLPPESICDPILRLRGLRLDSVDAIHDLPALFRKSASSDMRSWIELMRRSHRWCDFLGLPQQYRCGGLSLIRAFLQTISADDFWGQPRNTHANSTARARFYMAYRQYLTRQGSTAVSVAGRVWDQDQFCAFLASRFNFCIPSDEHQTAVDESISAADLAYLEQLLIAAFRSHVAEKVRHRTLLVTRNGYIGLGPFQSEVTDEVCILPGSTVPLVLRPTTLDNGGRTYRLIGDAYIEGVMYGEIFKRSGEKFLEDDILEFISLI